MISFDNDHVKQVEKELSSPFSQGEAETSGFFEKP